MQKFAYGTLGLKPGEFWELTPREFRLMADGFAEEEKRRFENLHHLLAWHAANVMNASGNLKRPVSVEKLLGKKSRKQGKTLTPEEQKAELERLKKLFGRG